MPHKHFSQNSLTAAYGLCMFRIHSKLQPTQPNTYEQLLDHLFSNLNFKIAYFAIFMPKPA